VNLCIYMIPQCTPQLCFNNGIFFDIAVSNTTIFNCQCANGFTGIMCETGEHL